jgi:hypothetical protein
MTLSGSDETPRLDVSTEELEALVEQARVVLPEDGHQKLLGAVHTLRYVTELLEKKEASLANLRELLCPATTEKTEKVLKQAGIESGPESPRWRTRKRAVPSVKCVAMDATAPRRIVARRRSRFRMRC